MRRRFSTSSSRDPARGAPKHRFHGSKAPGGAASSSPSPPLPARFGHSSHSRPSDRRRYPSSQPPGWQPVCTRGLPHRHFEACSWFLSPARTEGRGGAEEGVPAQPPTIRSSAACGSRPGAWTLTSFAWWPGTTHPWKASRHQKTAHSAVRQLRLVHGPRGRPCLPPRAGTYGTGGAGQHAGREGERGAAPVPAHLSGAMAARPTRYSVTCCICSPMSDGAQRDGTLRSP
jgi:hypothetical protein